MIYLKDIKSLQFADNVQGIGMCGYPSYIYANDGFGNSESYYSIQNLLNRAMEDGYGDVVITSLKLNENKEIISLYGYIEE